jgi:predicted alpha/beta hydrolase family esterase
MTTETFFLTVPGLASSGPQHWQTKWEQKNPDQFKRVEQDNWDWPVKHDWVHKLQEEIEKLTKPTILVAHSLGCLTVVNWAAKFTSPHIVGALLVAPADAEISKRLTFVVGFKEIPQQALPFHSVVVASTNDRYASIARSEKFAKDWGSHFINLGKKGHINAVSGLGAWEEGQFILETIVQETMAGAK